jgi:hypothetical protein
VKGASRDVTVRKTRFVFWSDDSSACIRGVIVLSAETVFLCNFHVCQADEVDLARG